MPDAPKIAALKDSVSLIKDFILCALGSPTIADKPVRSSSEYGEKNNKVPSKADAQLISKSPSLLVLRRVSIRRKKARSFA